MGSGSIRKRVLITGGAGFIGSNAASRFTRRGHEVHVADNLSRQGSRVNAQWLEQEHGLRVDVMDVRDVEATAEVVRRYNPEIVLHCAGQVAVTTSVTDPRSDFLDNAVGTFNVLEAVRQHAPSAVFLYTSTNKVYGGMEDVETRLSGSRYGYVGLPMGCAETQPLDFHSPYGCSKGAADQYVRDYARMYGMRTIVFRQSCIYGYRQFGMEDQGWVAWFTIRASQRRPVTIYGDGKQVRDILFIDDLVDAFEAAVANVKRVQGQVFNVGGGPENTLSLGELVTMLGELTGTALDVSYADWRPGDQRVFVCDIRKARQGIEWEPKVRVRDGVARLFRWVKDNASLFA